MTVDTRGAWLHVQSLDVELAAARDGFLSGSGSVERGGVRVPVRLRGGDRFYLSAVWVEVGEPLFVAGTLERRGEEAAVREAPGARIIVSAQDERATSAWLAEHRVGAVLWSRIFLALAPLCVVLAALGFWFFDD